MKISVITINRNDAAGLEKTIQSVIGQDYSDVEYIVIDGASTDGSIDVIHAHAQHIAYWQSEPDTGIYNAMNKGIAKATGEWLIFMNAGDIFATDTILSEFAAGNYTDDIVFGDQIRVMADGTHIQWNGPEKADFLFFYCSGVPHQSTFTRKQVFDQLGGFREDFRIYSDWAHVELAVLRHGMNCKHIPLTVSVYDKTGISSSPEQRHIRRQEIAESRNNLLAPIVWELAEECLKLRNELAILKKHWLVRFAITTSKKIKKKMHLSSKKSKHMSVIHKELS